jgi:RNA polymerase sigma-70 factor (ECF subfamily)
MMATRTGDAQALTQLLAEDAVLHSDGGGKRPAALRPIDGRDKIVRFFVGVAGKADLTGAFVYTPARINGQPGYVVHEPDGSVSSVSLELRDGLVASIYIVRNPEKLGHLLKTSGS